jgi:putative polyhydroxyalkanoate system protein
MSDISVKRSHGMEFDQAKDKVHEIVSDLQNDIEYIDKVSWNGDGTAADIKGKGFSGDVRVNDSDVIMEIKLKLFAKPFKGTIEEKITKRMDSYFG